MRFQCPSCGFSGGVRIPAHLPKGKTVRIRCSRCQEPFPLSLGKLFPQEYPASYEALIPDSLGCRGRRVGGLWVETVGSRKDGTPVLVFPAHPFLPHDVMHDLLDSFGEYFRICYIEFPGTRRNPQEAGNWSCGALFSNHIEALKKHLGASRFHLLAHLGSAPLALDVAARHPDSVTSVVLIEPDLRLAEHSTRQAVTGKLKHMDPEELLVSLFQDIWDSQLPLPHARGLARILSAGFQPENLNRELVHSRSALHYSVLSRRKTPILILYSKDGSEAVRKCALCLQASLPAAQTGPVERGGAWAAWFQHSAIANRLLAFKRSAESGEQRPPRKRSQTLSGQPLGWMVLVFALLAAGLTVGSNLLRFQPAFMSRVIPPLLAGLLPILWFVIPKKINPIAFFRFRRFSVRTVLLPLAVGTLLGAFYRSLLLTLKNVPLPAALPEYMISLAPGSRGRLFELAGTAIVGLFVFGTAENLWVLRRSRLQILLPTALFTLLPPAFPDILWKLPGGFAAAVLFSAGLSIYSPLFLIAGFAAASELPVPYERLPVSWASVQGVGVTIALLAAAILLTVFVGSGGKTATPEELYFAGTINREDRSFRWSTSLGIVMVVFSLIAAAAFLFGFLSV